MSSERLPRRRRNKLDKRERIRAAAMRLFNERGFARTTTKAIAEEAGVAAGTIFLYARDKTDLLVLAMTDELTRIIEERFATLPPPPLLEQILHVSGGFLSFYASHPQVAAPFVQALYGPRTANTAALDRLTLAAMERFAALIEAAKSRGEIAADVPSLLLAQNCFALYVSAVGALLQEYVATVEEALVLLRMATELQLRGLGPR